MGVMSSFPRWPSSRRLRATIAVGLGLIGVVLIWAALVLHPAPGSAPAVAPPEQSGPSEPPHPSETATSAEPTTSTRPAPTSPDRSAVRDRIRGPVLPESDPVALSIPRIGVRSSLVHLGLDAAGAMEVPRDPSLAGWFSQGAAPGALGPAIIAGHVTWDGAPAVFHRLGALRRGDSVAIKREDGKTAVFTVSRVDRFPKSKFPSRAVYGAIDHAGLRLITCGGTYDAARHRYLDNVVVFAKLTTVRGPRD
jgi:sortase (surface protein transpeptidase)